MEKWHIKYRKVGSNGRKSRGSAYLIICELCEQMPSVYFFRKVSIFSGKIAHSVFKEALRCFHKKFTKFTKFTHFRVRVWRGAAFQIVPDSSKWFHLRFARSSGRRRRIIDRNGYECLREACFDHIPME